MRKKKIGHPEILNALLKNCKQSDREIAKYAKVSQPTVTRFRGKLEKTGIIKHYMAIPDFAKLGYTFGSVITGQIFAEASQKEVASLKSVVLNAPSIGSLNNNIMLISLHKNMEDYEAFLKKIKAVIVNSTISLFSTKGLDVKAIQIPERIRFNVASTA